MTNTIGVIAEARRRSLVRELAAARAAGAPAPRRGSPSRDAQGEPEQGRAGAGDQRAQQSDGRHERHDHTEGGVRRVLARRRGGHARAHETAGRRGHAERCVDPARAQPLHGRLAQRLARLDA
ncbi:hypothetical protein [Streptomyces sp. AK010]|uniref:hypothetical protein n=1 Tax=Streptomyces sp. AK010 TaxID=2723074 RepID=UPI00161CB8C7|nr:hypothetical protein [Streptomyces sp. AK010]MBB6420764.1 hypothetical protein [Streptomyces sp. AK010]